MPYFLTFVACLFLVACGGEGSGNSLPSEASPADVLFETPPVEMSDLLVSDDAQKPSINVLRVDRGGGDDFSLKILYEITSENDFQLSFAHTIVGGECLDGRTNSFAVSYDINDRRLDGPIVIAAGKHRLHVVVSRKFDCENAEIRFAVVKNPVLGTEPVTPPPQEAPAPVSPNDPASPVAPPIEPNPPAPITLPAPSPFIENVALELNSPDSLAESCLCNLVHTASSEDNRLTCSRVAKTIDRSARSSLHVFLQLTNSAGETEDQVRITLKAQASATSAGSWTVDRGEDGRRFYRASRVERSANFQRFPVKSFSDLSQLKGKVDLSSCEAALKSQLPVGALR